MRFASVERKTNETSITVSLCLDGGGVYDIATGIGFFDHMLEQLCKHSLTDITLKAEGDLHIDFHHTVEDCGWALGAAFKQALGDKKGIQRYGHAYLPMDETLSRVAVDVSGRPYFIWDVAFPSEKIGMFDTELFREFFQAFSQGAGMTFHAGNLYGTNSHHIAESLFKAAARALKAAIAPDARAAGKVPSTKGVL